MKSLRAFFSRFASLFHRSARDRDLSAELDSHLQLHIDENISRGMDPAEARRAALIKLGGLAQTTERYRARRGLPFLETLVQDLRYAVRMLAKSPSFTAVAILTLALGIGANTAIFSFIDAVLLRALPVKDPQQLVLLRWSAHGRPKISGFGGYGYCPDLGLDADCSFSVPFFKTIRAQDNAFSGMAAIAGPIDVDLNGNGAASIAHGTFVSGDFFSTLGVNAFIGRPLAPSDDTASAPPAIVLDYAYWQRAFAGDRSVIGRAIHLDNVPVTIVGVADAHFTSVAPGITQDFYLPFSLSDRVKGEWWGNQKRASNAGLWWVVMLGRLKPGVSIGQAQVAANTIFRNTMLHSAPPVFAEADAPAITILPARDGLNGETSDIAPGLYLTMVIVAFILLIACANVAGLTLARSASRQKEMAVRLALGAGRSRVIRQLLTESVLLSLIGGALGILFAVWGVAAIDKLIVSGTSRPFPYAVSPDWRVLLFTIAVTLATGILFGLAPALRGSRLDLTPSLKENSSSLPGSAAHSSRWFRLGDALVIAQVALSIVVLIGAGLLVRTLRNLRSINPGFDTRNILLFTIDPTIAGYTEAQTQQLYSNLQQRFAALPGVLSVSYSEDALLDGGTSGDDVHLDGAPPKQNINTYELTVGLNFFSTMRIPILVGRAFTSADFAVAIATNAAQQAMAAASPNNSVASTLSSAASYASAQRAYSHSAPIPVIINESFARKFLANQNPVGLHMGNYESEHWTPATSGPGYIIVGICGDTKYAYINRDIAPMMFLPLVSNSVDFELRTAANSAAFVKSVREIVSRVGNNLPLTEVRTQTEQVEEMLFQQRLLSKLAAFFAALALVLACVGLYGLLAYEVARRTRELGIRMALGAQRKDLLRLVVGQGILLVLIGTAIGIGAAIGVTRYMSSMLYGIHANDPSTFAGVAILLALVALAACYIPARRAMRVDPMVALRYE